MAIRNYPKNIPPIDRAVVRNRMNYLREKAGYSFSQLSRKTGISISTLGQMEIGCADGIPFAVVISVAKALGADPYWLIGWDDTIPEDAAYIELSGEKWLLPKSTIDKLRRNNEVRNAGK